LFLDVKVNCNSHRAHLGKTRTCKSQSL